jgi:hypothetical protein
MRPWPRPGARFVAGARCAAAVAALAVAAVLAWSCGGGEKPTGNLFINPGFEQGSGPWASLTTEAWEPHFDLATGEGHEAPASAFLQMRTDDTSPGTRIWGVMQEVSPKKFPDLLEGWYRVDNWDHATAKQYLQVVVIAFGSTNAPENFPNHQIRYILGGISAPPFVINNAKYVFINTADPVQGQWQEFRRDVANDFRELWGDVPRGFEKIRVLFEVRYDDKTPTEHPAADVHYDDLYLGSAK